MATLGLIVSLSVIVRMVQCVIKVMVDVLMMLNVHQVTLEKTVKVGLLFDSFVRIVKVDIFCC